MIDFSSGPLRIFSLLLPALACLLVPYRISAQTTPAVPCPCRIWIDADTKEPVPSSPDSAAYKDGTIVRPGIDVTDMKHAHNPENGKDFTLRPDGQWVDSKTGACVSSRPMAIFHLGLDGFTLGPWGGNEAENVYANGHHYTRIACPPPTTTTPLQPKPCDPGAAADDSCTSTSPVDPPKPKKPTFPIPTVPPPTATTPVQPKPCDPGNTTDNTCTSPSPDKPKTPKKPTFPIPQPPSATTPAPPPVRPQPPLLFPFVTNQIGFETGLAIGAVGRTTTFPADSFGPATSFGGTSFMIGLSEEVVYPITPVIFTGVQTDVIFPFMTATQPNAYNTSKLDLAATFEAVFGANLPGSCTLHFYCGQTSINVSGGGAIGVVNSASTFPGFIASDQEVLTGFTVAGDVTTMVSPHIAVFLETRYTSLPAGKFTLFGTNYQQAESGISGSIGAKLVFGGSKK